MTEAKEIQLGNLGGSSPQDSISSNSQDLVINIPEELQGHGIVVNYGASWISNLSVNDSNNTVTSTVSANNTYNSRSTTITLTASGNLSTTSPYSFTLTQAGKSESCSVSLRFEGTGFIYAVFVKQGNKTIYTASGFNLPATYSTRLDYPNWTFPSSGSLTFEYNRTGALNRPDTSGTVSPNYATFPVGGSVTLECSAYD